MLFDAHTHAWGPPDAHEWHSAGPAGATRIVYTADDLLADMDRLGVDRALLVATPIEPLGSPYTLDAVAEHDAFDGIVLLDPSADDIRDQVATTVGRDGIHGVRLGDGDLDAARDAFFEAIAAHGGQVHLQLSTDGLPAAADRIAAHPDVDFVFDHLGPFDHDDPALPSAAAVAEHANAYVKITHTASGPDARYPFPGIHDRIHRLYETFGPDRLLWGSDYVYHFKKVVPWQTREFVDELPFLSTADRRKLLGRNAERLLQ